MTASYVHVFFFFFFWFLHFPPSIMQDFPFCSQCQYMFCFCIWEFFTSELFRAPVNQPFICYYETKEYPSFVRYDRSVSRPLSFAVSSNNYKKVVSRRHWNLDNCKMSVASSRNVCVSQ